MKAVTSDWVGWIVGLALCVAMAVFVLWPSLKKKAAEAEFGEGGGAGGAGGAGYNTAAINDPQFDAQGVPAAGAPVDQNGAPRQAIGAAGMPAPVPSSSTFKLTRLYAPPI